MDRERYSRQSFLGPTAQTAISKARIAVIGLGGGGSHIAQQLAYVGVENYVLYDGDVGKRWNLNRTIGLTLEDVKSELPKVDATIRTIRALHPEASVDRVQMRWQDRPEPLRSCDLVFGCVDGFAERRELEACCRRYLIPYIDIGIDVHEVKPQPPVMSGQVIASVPGGPCLFCLGFLNEEKLSREAAKYGDAGVNPQVVWANGVIASTAVGIGVDMITGWTKEQRNVVYLMYEGNKGTLKPHPRLRQLETWQACPHYPDNLVGDPKFTRL